MNDNYLRRIRQTYYVQVRVPRPLVSIVGKQHLLRSTKTRDVVEARRRRHAIVAEFHKLIDAARQLQVSHENGLTGELVNSAAVLRRQVQTNQVTRSEALEEWELMLDRLHRLPPSAVSDTQVEAIRDAGEAIRTPRIHLSDAATAYLASNPSLRPSTIHKRRRRLEALRSWTGDIPIDALTRQQVGKYVSDALQPRGITPNTIRQTLSDLSSWYRWSIARGHATNANPFEGVSSTVRDPARGTATRTNKKWRAWADDELALLAQHAAGEHLIMSLLALYTGCRENELAESALEDVRETHLHLPEAKSEAGVRDIPWHPHIQPLVKHLTETSTDGYLVPGQRPAGYDNKRGHLFAKRFSHFKSRRLKLPRACVFHGFRKNFITQLVQHRVPKNEIQQLVGHEAGELVYDTYSAGVTIERLAEVVALVDYGDTVTAAIKRAMQEEPTRRTRGRPRRR